MKKFFKGLLTLNKKEEPSPLSLLSESAIREQELQKISQELSEKLESFAILSMSVNVESVERQLRANEVNREIITASEELLTLDLKNTPMVSIKKSIDKLYKLINDFKMIVTN